MISVRLHVFRALMVAFALATLPAIVWRWQQVQHVPPQFALIARILFVSAIAWDAYLLYEALVLRVVDLRWRFGLKFVPRFILTLALALLVDAPAYSRQMLNVEIMHRAQADTALDRPAAFRKQQYERDVEYWHFMLDGPTMLVPRANAARLAFYQQYAGGAPGTMMRLRIGNGCRRFVSEAAAVSLGSYPTIEARVDRVAGFCAARAGRIPLAARDYITHENDLVTTPLPAFGAIFDADSDGASPALIRYLQQQLLATDASRSWMRTRCVQQYRESLRSITWNGHWTAQLIAQEKKWRSKWHRLFGSVCGAVHAREPYLVRIPSPPPPAPRARPT